MIAHIFRTGSHAIDWQDIAFVVALLVFVASMIFAVILYMMKKRSSSSTSKYGCNHGVKTDSQELQSLEQDQKRKATEKFALKKFVAEIEYELNVIRKTIEEKLGLCKQHDNDLTSIEHESLSLKDKLRKLEDEKLRLEKEVQDLTLCSNLQQRAVIAGKPGDEFFVRVKFEGATSNPSYQDVIMGKDFEVPLELPKINDEKIEWAFSSYKHGVVINIDTQTAETFSEKLYFIGDIHGDVNALCRALKFAFTNYADAKVVFLGDVFDRGEKGLEATRLLVWAAKNFPGQILWLCGNHDIGLRYDDVSGSFASDVNPSEFKDFLNANPVYKDEGRAIVNIIKQLPVACVIGNVWASHGGVPRSDVSGEFRSFEAMSEVMVDDCAWSRMTDLVKKLPNRPHRDAEIGFKDVCQFFDVLKTITGIVINHIVCAHQHEHTGDVGYLQFKRYYKPETLSCQCISTFQDKECHAKPCILIYKGSVNPPTPHTI